MGPTLGPQVVPKESNSHAPNHAGYPPTLLSVSQCIVEIGAPLVRLIPIETPFAGCFGIGLQKLDWPRLATPTLDSRLDRRRWPLGNIYSRKTT